jgi:hypothetical protein
VDGVKGGDFGGGGGGLDLNGKRNTFLGRGPRRAWRCILAYVPRIMVSGTLAGLTGFVDLDKRSVGRDIFGSQVGEYGIKDGIVCRIAEAIQCHRQGCRTRRLVATRLDDCRRTVRTAGINAIELNDRPIRPTLGRRTKVDGNRPGARA